LGELPAAEGVGDEVAPAFGNALGSVEILGGDSGAGFFLPTVDFLPVPGGNVIYRGIPRYTAKYRSNSNFKPKPILTASSNGLNGIPRYK
jgi:hypothetical protein